MHILDSVDAASLRTDVPEFRAGDTLKVHVNIIEGKNSRVQVFQGFVLGRQGDGVRETFTVRKVSFGVGVERTFPVHSPIIDKIELVTKGDVRRAKLYYMRALRGKAAKIKEKRDFQHRQVSLPRLPPRVHGPYPASAGAIRNSAHSARIRNMEQPKRQPRKLGWRFVLLALVLAVAHQRPCPLPVAGRLLHPVRLHGAAPRHGGPDPGFADRLPVRAVRPRRRRRL